MRATIRRRLIAATGGIPVCVATAILSWPRAGLATPPQDFASEFADVYLVVSTVAAGGYSGGHVHMVRNEGTELRSRWLCRPRPRCRTALLPDGVGVPYSPRGFDASVPGNR